MEEATFGVWDYVVLILMLLTSSSIGIYYKFTGGKQKTVQEYLLADRSMPFTPVAFSLMASFMSAITLIGVSNENYSFGVQFIVINFAYGFATPIAAYLYIPVFFKLQATSAYEYLQKRFGRTTRLSASIAYSLQMILYMGIVLYAPAIALEALTGISKVTAILVIGIVCTFYSTIGGMKAVLVTDVFQSLLMFVAIFSIIICAAIEAGGLGKIWEIAEKGGRTELFNFNPDPTIRHSVWSLVIGGMVTYLTLYAVNQTQVQRYLTVKDLKTAQKALWLNWPILTLLSLSTSFAGLSIYSKYYNCDPMKSKRISTSDQLMPLYVVDTMTSIPGISGLFVAGIFSASLSTVSASLNSLAAVTLEDYIKPLYKIIYKKSFPIEKSSFYSKIMAFVYGGVCLAVAFSAEHLGGVLQASLTIFGAVGGPLLAIFTLGMFTTIANQKGVLCGLATGIAFTFWISFGGPKPPLPLLPVSIDGCNSTILKNFTENNFTPVPVNITKLEDESEYFYLYRISYLYTSLFGLVITFVIGLIMSIIFRTDNSGLDPNLFVPPLARKLRQYTFEKKPTGSQENLQPSLNLESFKKRIDS